MNLSAIGFHSTSKMAAQSYLLRINQQNGVGRFQYSDWLSRYPHKAGVAKNVRDVLRKWTPRKKYVQYQNFPTHFGLLLSLDVLG